MAEVTWIKITTNMFDNRKIKLIRKLPNGTEIVLFWVMLLTLAGRSNSQGYILLTEFLPYTPEMLADEFNIDLKTVKLSLDIFIRFNMINVQQDVISIANWDEYQNIEGLERIREQNRLRQQKHRDNTKLLEESNVTRNVTVTHSNATEEELEEELDIDIDNKNKEEGKPSIPSQKIIDLYNSICGSKLPAAKFLSEDRKRLIKTAWNKIKGSDEEKLDIFTNLFNITAKNSFLTGENSRGWRADFNWLLKEKNMIKVLEDSYASSSKKNTGNFDNFEHREYDYDNLEKELLGQTGQSDEEPEYEGEALTMEDIKKRARGKPND